MVRQSHIVTNVGFNGGIVVCEALRLTCRRTFWQIQRLYSWLNWALDDLHDRILHYHQFQGFDELLRMHSRRLASTFVTLTYLPIRCNPHLVATVERTASILGFPQRPRRSYPGGTVPQCMLY